METRHGRRWVPQWPCNADEAGGGVRQGSGKTPVLMSIMSESGGSEQMKMGRFLEVMWF